MVGGKQGGHWKGAPHPTEDGWELNQKKLNGHNNTVAYTYNLYAAGFGGSFFAELIKFLGAIYIVASEHRRSLMGIPHYKGFMHKGYTYS